METLSSSLVRQQQRSALTTRPTPVYRNLPAQLAFSQRSCQHISLFPFPQASSSPKLRFFAHTQRESLTAFRQTLANEKFGVIFTFARHLAQPGELWPLPVRACHESPFMVALGIRKLSPPVTRKSFLVVFGYGSRCEDRVCRVLARYDHFSAIRSVFWLLLLCLLWVRKGFAGVSFDSDYKINSPSQFFPPSPPSQT